MNAHRLLAALLVLILLPWGAHAQDSGQLYAWEAGDLALAIPPGWERPVSITVGETPVLQMAQVLAGTPDLRPPDVPAITLTLYPDLAPDADLAPVVQDALAAQVTPPTSEIVETSFAGGVGVTASGESPDGALFGIARAARLEDGRVLLVVGRAPMANRGRFVTLFDSVVESIIPSLDGLTLVPTYGLMWFTLSTPDDGERAFLNLAGLAYVDGRLYSVDPALGVLTFDTQTGRLLAVSSNDALRSPTSVAADADGTLYIADPGCGCVHVMGADGRFEAPLTGFGEGAPLSVAVDAGGTVYATDAGVDGFGVRALGGEAELLPLPPTDAQPPLGIDREGRLLALTTAGELLVLEDGAFSVLGQLPGGLSTVSALAADPNGSLILATDEGLMQAAPGSDAPARVGEFVEAAPIAGQVVAPRGVVFDAVGTLYVADSDGTFGALTAFSPGISPERFGAPDLIPDVAVMGLLTDDAPRQAWTFTAAGGEIVTLSAIDAGRTGELDLALRLLAPDGTEAAANDNQLGSALFSPLDAQIADLTPAQAGTYTVLVEAIAGEGIYRLGLTLTRPLTLDPDGETEISGTLDDVFAAQRWQFEAEAGMRLTITHDALGGTLDPVVRLFAPDGTLLAENDDADNPELGLNAQLAGLVLPETGVYTLETARFDGAGDYRARLVVES